jgi:hypothetical protein
MHNVADIFAFWPSDADLARDINVPYPTVSAWKQRGSIPPGHWRAIILAARRRGFREITADLLLSAHTPASDEKAPGFQEEEPDTFVTEDASAGANEPERLGDGHFSRHKHVRRHRFRSAEEIEDHIRALREEWSHR